MKDELAGVRVKEPNNPLEGGADVASHAFVHEAAKTKRDMRRKDEVLFDTGVLGEYHVFGSDKGMRDIRPFNAQVTAGSGLEKMKKMGPLDLKFVTTEGNPKITTLQALIMEQ